MFRKQALSNDVIKSAGSGFSVAYQRIDLDQGQQRRLGRQGFLLDADDHKNVLKPSSLSLAGIKLFSTNHWIFEMSAGILGCHGADITISELV